MKHLICHEFAYQTHNGRPGSCRIDAFDHGTSVVFILNELNSGISVTNAAEYIQTAVMKHQQFLTALPHMNRENVIFIEHYSADRTRSIDSWDLVKCEWDDAKKEFHSPSWSPVAMHVIKEYTGNKYP